jgi:hypothetical protein
MESVGAKTGTNKDTTNTKHTYDIMARVLLFSSPFALRRGMKGVGCKNKQQLKYLEQTYLDTTRGVAGREEEEEPCWRR